MSTIASTLLDFIIGLFSDPQKAAAYEADPRGALDAAGLTDVPEGDVAELVPLVADYSTVGCWDGGAQQLAVHPERGAEPVGYRPVSVGNEEPEVEHGGSGGGAGVQPATAPAGAAHAAPAPVGGAETVVVTHLQEVHYSHTENTLDIDASHGIWVSGDAQAIFGDVKGDVTQIDNEGGIVAGRNVEDSSVDHRDQSVNDSNNTEIEDSNVNVGGNQAVDSFNQDNDGLDVDRAERSFNGNGSNNEDNDVTADRGGQVGDNTAVRVDDVNHNTGDGTLVSESSDSGNDNSDNSVVVRDSGNDNSDNSVDVRDSGNDNSDNSDNSINESFDDESDRSVDIEDSGNDNSVNDSVVGSEID
jgi:hypothetical protein